MTPEKSRVPIDQTINSLGDLFAAPGEAIVDGLSGESPFKRPRQRLKSAIEDTLKFPFRAIRDITFGTSKKVLKLLGKGVLNAPFIPVK
ncbi:hypothetical protein KKF55_01740 [Patescibacteria group bacterium]|nr:hypothetical protein [Patescibacteria group bacterium]